MEIKHESTLLFRQLISWQYLGTSCCASDEAEQMFYTELRASVKYVLHTDIICANIVPEQELNIFFKSPRKMPHTV